MNPVWAQRREEIGNDGLVSPDVCTPRVQRLGAFVVPSQPALEPEGSGRPVHLSLQGGLSALERKQAEQIATFVAVEPQVIQDFVGPVPWAHRPLGTVWVGQGAARWGDPAGLLAFAPRSFPKRGRQSVGGKRPGCGHRGKVDNCQGGVCRGDVSHHDQVVLAFRLALPEAWARDEPRRQACHVPPEVRYPTRHEPCLERREAWGHQVPPGWVTGEDERGRPTRFRGELRQRGEREVLGGPCTTAVRALEGPSPAYHGRGRRPTAPWQSVTHGRPALPGHAWTHWTVRDGAKGPVEIERVRRRVQTRIERQRTGPEAWLVVTRRPLSDDRLWESRAARDATDQDTG